MIFSLETGPRFPRHGAGNRGSISSKTPLWKSEPNLSRIRGKSSLRPFAYKPKSKPAVWILDFGVWILEFGFWILDLGFWILDFRFRILDFGSWILDCRSIRSFCGSPKRGRLDFGFWISDSGFRILDFGTRFGFCIKLLLLHADSGRRIYRLYIYIYIFFFLNYIYFFAAMACQKLQAFRILYKQCRSRVANC